MRERANSKNYLEKNFPELLKYKQSTSRVWEKKEDPRNHDNWWFKFMEDDLEESEFIIFAGALDYINREFKIFKVPADFLKANRDKLDINSKGWTNLYIHIKDFVDLRHPANLSFREFVVL
ncbi:MAG: hypothetical protein JSS81_05515 [Acidobacteria bacterium]|nr:hypothetical protein [Acidobacteriota bacterium]